MDPTAACRHDIAFVIFWKLPATECRLKLVHVNMPYMELSTVLYISFNGYVYWVYVLKAPFKNDHMENHHQKVLSLFSFLP